MDAKLVNPFIDALVSVMPMMGFDVPKRAKMGVKNQTCKGLGVSILVGFTKGIRGNVVYNMSAEAAKFIASKMMMGMPIAELDDMAQSALSEMSNMLTANAATNLAAMGLTVDISTPSLTVGESFQIKISNENYLVVDMDIGGQIMELNIAVQE